MSTGCKSSHNGFLDVSRCNDSKDMRLDWPTVMFDETLVKFSNTGHLYGFDARRWLMGKVP